MEGCSTSSRFPEPPGIGLSFLVAVVVWAALLTALTRPVEPEGALLRPGRPVADCADRQPPPAPDDTAGGRGGLIAVGDTRRERWRDECEVLIAFASPEESSLDARWPARPLAPRRPTMRGVS